MRFKGKKNKIKPVRKKQTKNKTKTNKKQTNKQTTAQQSNLCSIYRALSKVFLKGYLNLLFQIILYGHSKDETNTFLEENIGQAC